MRIAYPGAALSLVAALAGLSLVAQSPVDPRPIHPAEAQLRAEVGAPMPALPLATVPAAPAAAPEVVPNSYIVLFQQRSFDLEAYRQAIYDRRPAAEVEVIVRGLDTAVERDQHAFAQAVKALGGTVTEQWWIVNGACVTLPAERLPALRALPNVARVEANAVHYPVNRDARNAIHHNAAGANTRQVGGKAVNGQGVGAAVLDTGIDASMGSTGRPHRGYFVNGDPLNTTGSGLGGSRVVVATGTSGYGAEDSHGHGTHVSGSVLNAWSADMGMAPGANLVGVKISNNSGGAQSNWLISGWQQVAALRAQHNVLVANNSFSGSPSLNDGIQQALDGVAYNSDVLIACAAGNNGTNTQSSQNVWNGLAVGSLNKGSSFSYSSFSGRGPLYGSGRTYPDIMGVGAGVYSLNKDSETTVAQSSGTSMASPMVCGGGALVRQVDPAMKAQAAKALLLNTTKGPQTSRNTHGLGVLDCDAAVAAAIAKDWADVQLTAQNPVWSRPVVFPQPGAITIAWMRNPSSGVLPNLDLTLYDAAGTTQVAKDGNTLNSYEKVAVGAGVWRVEVRWVNPSGTTIDFGIAGVGAQLPTNPPTLTGITPGATTSGQPVEITLTGTLLDTVGTLTVGGVNVSGFKVVDPQTLKFTPPVPFAIATHPVTVANAAGASNALNLRIDGDHPAILKAPLFAARGFPTSAFELHTDRNWNAVVFVSLSNAPSVAPGIVQLGIGAGFTQVWQAFPMAADARGFAQLPGFTMPLEAPPGVVYWQAIPFDPAAPTLPLESSNSTQTTVF